MTNAKNKRALKATVFGGRRDSAESGYNVGSEHGPGEVSVEKAGKPEGLDTDPDRYFRAQGLIEPPYNLYGLSLLLENNSELGQCVQAMELNIDGVGHRFVQRDPNKESEESDDEATERLALENFFSAVTDEPFTKFRRKLRVDLETTGNAYFEVVRSLDGSIQSFQHIRSHSMRLGKLMDAALADRWVTEKQKDGSVTHKKIQRWKRFRRYAQVVDGKLKWFKEFGDMRALDHVTGELKPGATWEEQANEVVHFALYSPRTPYGIPRFAGNLLSIYGDRAAEEINFTTFKNNNIPSMLIMVSNGQLTEGSINRINSFVESQIRGSDNYSKFLLLEAEGEGEEGEDGGNVKLSIERLTSEQRQDAMFLKYSAENADKIRRAFRLPPIFVGRSGDYNRATAESSRRLADEQVFGPERDAFDSFVNEQIMPELGAQLFKFKSNSPNTTDHQELVKILNGSEKTGGITPRIARQVLEEVLGRELPRFPPDFPADVPFSITIAEKIKNQADPTEPGQQVTALKELGQIATDVNQKWAEYLRSGELYDE